MYWPRLATALLIAAHVWGMPSCGTPNVAYADPPSDPAGGRMVSWTLPGRCTIYLSNRLRWAGMPATRCTALVHEWGHLTGHGHSQDPYNVMYPVIGWTYWRCEPRAERDRASAGR